MTRRATISQADWNRAMKAAAAHGYVVEYKAVDGIIRLLPAAGVAEQPSGAPTAAREALKRWRQSA